MKKLTIVLLLIAPLLVLGQRRPKIKGSREVTEVIEALPPFNAIELKDDLEVELKKSLTEGYEITADDNLIEVLKLEVQDQTLVISSFYDIVSKKKLAIRVNVKDIETLKVNAGKVFGKTTLDADRMQLQASGKAAIDLTIKAFQVSVNLEENSKVNLNLEADSLNLNVRQKANASIYTAGTSNNIVLQEGASVSLEGSAANLYAELGGNSKLKADKLEAANTDLVAAESAFARIKAHDAFSLSASGNAKVHLYGNPKISIQQFIDSVQLLKKKD